MSDVLNKQFKNFCAKRWDFPKNDKFQGLSFYTSLFLLTKLLRFSLLIINIRIS